MKTDFIYKSILTLAAPLLVAACASDSYDIPDPKPIQDDFEGIIVKVPQHKYAATRATSLEADEGKVNNLTILAYNQEKENGSLKYPLPVVKETKVAGNQIYDVDADDNEKYVSVPFRLSPGDYHIYVVANVLTSDWRDHVSVDKWDKLEESDLQGLHIITKPLVDSDNLPMTCNYAAIKSSNLVKDQNGNFSWSTPALNGKDGTVKINPRETTRVYADLTFAVAKVKYSIVNGKLSFLTMIDNPEEEEEETKKEENSEDLIPTRVQFLNYTDHSSLMTHAESEDFEDGKTHISSEYPNVGTSGAYYKFTDNKWYEYDDSTGPLDTTAFAEIKTESDESDNPIMVALSDSELESLPKKWCFRGTAYVPERLFPEDWQTEDGQLDPDKVLNPTKIKFNFNTKEYSDKAEMTFGGDVSIPAPQDGTTHDHTGIIRGVVYEIKAFTTEKKITLQVRVRPWAYAKYTWIM